MCVRKLTFVLLEAEIHSACGFMHGTMFWFCLYLMMVRLQESLFFYYINGSRRLAFMSESDQLSDFQLVVCGFGWISLLLYTRLFDVVHCLSSCILLVSSHDSTGKAEGTVCSKILIHFLMSLLWLAICPTHIHLERTIPRRWKPYQRLCSLKLMSFFLLLTTSLCRPFYIGDSQRQDPDGMLTNI